MRLLSSSAVVVFALTGAARAQITEQPASRRRLKSAALAVEIRDVVRLPDTRKLRPVTEDVTPAGWARVSFVRDCPTAAASPTTRAGSSTSRGATSHVGLRWTSRPRFRSPIYNRARERLHRLRFHPEFAKNGLLYTVHASGPRQSGEAQLHPAGFTAADATFTT